MMLQAAISSYQNTIYFRTPTVYIDVKVEKVEAGDRCHWGEEAGMLLYWCLDKLSLKHLLPSISRLWTKKMYIHCAASTQYKTSLVIDEAHYLKVFYSCVLVGFYGKIGRS